MFAPYNEVTASLEDRIAWVLCQIVDDDAPMRWTRYRSAAVCIAANPNLMADLKALAERRTRGVPSSRERWQCLLCKSLRRDEHGTLDDKVTPCPNGVKGLDDAQR